MNRERNTGFYLEAIVILLVFILVIHTLVRVYAGSRSASQDAQRLTDAVILASNGAELVLASDTPDKLMEFLKEGNPKQENSVITVHFDDTLELAPDGEHELVIDWQETEADFVHAVITVYHRGTEVYTLTTGSYLEGAKS